MLARLSRFVCGEEEAMFDELDPADDIFHHPASSPDRKLGKFQPKARGKPVKVTSAAPKTSDATLRAPPLKPVALDTDSYLEVERPYLQPCVSNSCSVACDHHSMQESVGQSKSTLAEPVESEGKYVENFQQNQGNIDQDADMCFILDFPNGHLKTTGPVDNFRPKANSQHDDKELGVEESFYASTLCSGCNQTEATHSEINAAQQPFQAEQSILLKTSRDGECVQSGDIDASTKLSSMDSLYDLSHSSGATGMEAIVEDTSLAAASSGSNILSSELNATQQPLIAKEFAASKSTDDGVQISLSDGDLQAFPDNRQEVEMAMLSGLESLDEFSFQHNSTTDVRQVGKFQPRNKSQPKKGTAKSVSFILPDASITGPPPMGSFSSEITNPSSVQAKIDIPVDNPLQSSIITSDCNEGVQIDHREVGEENREEIGLPKGLEDIHTESQSQNVQKLKQRIHEGRPTSENGEDADAHKPCRKLRKRIAKCSTDQIEVGSNNERDIDNFNVSQMDGSRSDDCHRDEDMPKPKRTKRKSKRQTNEIEKPTQKRKKAFEQPDSVIDNSPKKKFPHATRRGRRQVNKVLLQTPEDEIDPRQISIRDLIMLAEAKERIASKEAAAMSKLFSGQSTSSLSNNEDILFGEDQELNHSGEEANQNVQSTPKTLNYHSYMNRPQTSRWSKAETKLFYEAIHQFGTDFAMIQQLFPNRTRHQVKLKFKIEERKHPSQVHDALLRPSKDRTHVMQVIKQLQTRAKPTTSNGETDGDQVNTLQDGVGKKEEETGGIQSDQEQQNDCEGEVEGPDQEQDDWKGEANSPSNFDEHQGLFEWDGATSPQDAEKDTLWEM
ncbi:hypothetical protein MUK42_16046 [Musa troglodytarum]|uniref:SANT domain-containing protein n=1 Tax=Musa troglodytarum TaxID=320322 RepID=A0A9E7HH53_9LILI|nr:hypothetical protein MUK42_16046 [Musa troglodytarum]